MSRVTDPHMDSSTRWLHCTIAKEFPVSVVGVHWKIQCPRSQPWRIIIYKGERVVSFTVTDMVIIRQDYRHIRNKLLRAAESLS